MMRLNIEYPIDREAYEFKNSLNGLDKGIKALAAMLNRNGKGEVFFGVSKEGDVTGLKGQIGVETIKMVEERISEVLKPAVTPTTIIEEYGGKKVIHVIVKGNDKPYAANGDYRIRIEDGNKKIDPDLMAKLFYESDRMALDSIESVEQNLSFSLLSFYLKNKGIEVDKDDFYSEFGLKRNDKYTLLSSLLSDLNKVCIRVTRYQGKDKSKTISFKVFGCSCLLKALKETLEYLLALNETKVSVGDDNAKKEEHLFDSEALKEACINAFVHNRWIMNIPPEINIYEDRIEVISTGGLSYGTSLASFYSGESQPVNRRLHSIFEKVGLIEPNKHGNSIIVGKYGRDAYTINENSIIVRIPLNFAPKTDDVDIENYTASTLKVYLAIKNNPSFTVKELSSVTGLGTTRIGEIIKELKEKGKIERVGSKKNGYWKVF